MTTKITTCQYCGVERKSYRSKVQHEIYCKSNPTAKVKVPSYGNLGKKGANQYTKGTAKPLSDETRKKFSERSLRQVWTDERRAKLSESMKAAVANNPSAYSSSNRGRVKQIEYNGIKFQGKWELAFYQWCEQSNVPVERNHKGFPYIWNGNRTYFPDFYLPNHSAYVEVKGYKTERDDAKWSQFPERLIIVDRIAIDNIRKGVYNLLV